MSCVKRVLGLRFFAALLLAGCASTMRDHRRWKVASTLIACVLLGMTACAGDDDDDTDRQQTQFFRECIITSAGQRFCSIVGQCGRRENDRCADPVFMCTTVQTTCTPCGGQGQASC